MIVIRMNLISAISEDRDTDLGTLVIDNITTRAKHVEHKGRVRDYRARMYRRGALAKAGGDASKMVSKNKPTRETRVLDHRALALPVQELVAKALNGMGYNATETTVKVAVQPPDTVKLAELLSA